MSEETKTSDAKDSILLGKFRQRGEQSHHKTINKELHYVSTIFISDPELQAGKKNPTFEKTQLGLISSNERK